MLNILMFLIADVIFRGINLFKRHQFYTMLYIGYLYTYIS